MGWLLTVISPETTDAGWLLLHDNGSSSSGASKQAACDAAENLFSSERNPLISLCH